jgi:hypothetical protein
MPRFLVSSHVSETETCFVEAQDKASALAQAFRDWPAAGDWLHGDYDRTDRSFSVRYEDPMEDPDEQQET